MVRGLDYYVKTAFEITGGNLGAQNSILGGGRYDGLSETLGGPKSSGIDPQPRLQGSRRHANVLFDHLKRRFALDQPWRPLKAKLARS